MHLKHKIAPDDGGCGQLLCQMLAACSYPKAVARIRPAYVLKR